MPELQHAGLALPYQQSSLDEQKLSSVDNRNPGENEFPAWGGLTELVGATRGHPNV